jgi:hypothetical protein
MCSQEKKEQELERQRDEFFNKLQPMASPQQWRAKAVSEALKEIRIKVVEEQGAADAEVLVKTKVNRSNRPATLVRPFDGRSTQDRSDRSNTPIWSVADASTQTKEEVLKPSQGCSEVWQNHLRNERFISQDHIRGFSMKREYINTTHTSIQYHIWSLNWVITH